MSSMSSSRERTRQTSAKGVGRRISRPRPFSQPTHPPTVSPLLFLLTQVRSDEISPLIHVELDPALGLEMAQQKKTLRTVAKACIDAGYAIGAQPVSLH